MTALQCIINWSEKSFRTLIFSEGPGSFLSIYHQGPKYDSHIEGMFSIDLERITDAGVLYEKFLDGIKNPGTLRHYTKNLARFLR